MFITTPEVEKLGHNNADDFAADPREMLYEGSFGATEEGRWLNHEDVNTATGKVMDKQFWLKYTLIHIRHT